MDVLRTAPGWVAARPRVLWVELTSKCPFDCVFCSRRVERGAGQHMEFSLFERILGQLDLPEIIRLNYAGESIHYPWLADAIVAARATGATTELVTALASAPDATIRGIVDAGLHRLSVSLHSLDAAQFDDLYRFSSLADLQSRLTMLLEYRRNRGRSFPMVELAFVAMEENVNQFGAIAEYARRLGIGTISVHPVIRRNRQVPPRFARAPEVWGQLPETPGVEIHVARPRGCNETVDAGFLTTCEQNPWETIHILADGRVVPCEVQDQTVMGDLNHESLAEIWHGAQYDRFRQAYSEGSNEACQSCAWRRTLREREKPATMIRGWHPPEADGTQWSQARAAMLVTLRPGDAGVRVSGVLSPDNEIRIHATPGPEARFAHAGPGVTPFSVDLPVPGSGVRQEVISIETAKGYCPAEQSGGTDLRRLGFALVGVRPLPNPQRAAEVDRLLESLRMVDRVRSALPRWRAGRKNRATGAGVTILVPARGDLGMTEPCLAAALNATAGVAEPCRVMVVASEAGDRTPRMPGVEWVSETGALSFQGAVSRGLKTIRTPWVYLLNSDMKLEADALREVLRLRGPAVFAVGSRIVMADGTLTETNWNLLRNHDGDAVELVERDPAGVQEARLSLYAGGGSSLFRTDLLRELVGGTRAYEPFYWEDVEWGVRAWQRGFEILFCPTSRAIHTRRQTVRRYYKAEEIERVFARNRLVFHLRNIRDAAAARDRLLAIDDRSWREIRTASTLWRRDAGGSASLPSETQEHVPDE